MFSLSSNHIGVCVPKKKSAAAYYFYGKINLIHMYGILKSAPFCFQSNVLRCPILIQPE